MDTASTARCVGRAVLEGLVVLTTLALLTSLTGLAAAAVLLVPAHLWAARGRGLAGRLAWGLLSGAAGSVGAGVGVNVLGTPGGWAAVAVAALGGLATGAVTLLGAASGDPAGAADVS